MQYSVLSKLYERLESTSKRLEKTYYLSKILAEASKNSSEKDFEELIFLLRGKLFPDWDERKLGVADRLVIKAISRSTGKSEQIIDDRWRETGDLGLVAQELVGSKVQFTLGSVELTIGKVFSNFRKLADLTGAGTVNRKVQLISELLTSAKPLEAKFIVRTVLEELRAGVGEGTIRDAITWAFFPPVRGVFGRCHEHGYVPSGLGKCVECKKDLQKENRKEEFVVEAGLKLSKPEDLLDVSMSKLAEIELIYAASGQETDDREIYQYLINLVQNAYDLINEFSAVALIAKNEGLNGLKNVKLRPGRPIKVMLAQKSAGLEDAFKRVGTPAAIEYKYDGFRMQIHKIPGSDGETSKVMIFTRRLDEVSKQFPEVVEYFEQVVGAESFILDGEAVGYDPQNGQYLPFQHISQRIKRKHGVREMAAKLPVELNIFDVIYLNGESIIGSAYIDRRKALEGLIKPEKGKVVLACQKVTSDEGEAQKFYQESLDKGNEGIMFKSLQNAYKPGSRVGFMVKLKPTMETLDLVITGAEWGEGKRAKWLTSFTLSCVEDGEFVGIGKVGTGIKELESEEEGAVTFNQLTEALKPLIIEQNGREVSLRPEIVVEIKYEEIQRSPTYSSGYALRFPRLVKLRDDLNPDEASNIEQVQDFFEFQ